MKNSLKHLFLLVLAAFISCSIEQPTSPITTGSSSIPASSKAFTSSLVVSTNSRYLLTQDGQPFFMSVDAAWSLIVQVTTADAEVYLKARSEYGFNTVIVNLIEHQFSDHPPSNTDNQNPFTGKTFTTPNELYFKHVDDVINIAAKYGIVVMLFPAYSGYQLGSQGWGAEMKVATNADMLTWGQYVGSRYKNFPNIIWCIGGDADPGTIQSKLQSMMDGIKQTDPNHLFTAHNAPESYGITPWVGQLNLNNVYTYSSSLYSNCKTAYSYVPTTPYFLIESAYENEHSSTPQSLRAQAYWTVLSGGCGEVFGNNPIWLFGGGWKNQLTSTGSVSMKNLAALVNSRHWTKIVPDFTKKIMTAGSGSSSSYAMTASTSDSSSIIAYLPSSRAVTVTTASLSGAVAGWWFNPSTGVNTRIANAVKGSASYTPPSSGDWVLVLDATSFGFAPPATVSIVPSPVGTFGADPVSLPIGGGSVALTWTSQNATSASIDGGVGTVALNGTMNVTVTATTTFTLALSGNGGTQSYKLTVTVATPPKPSGTFTATPNTLPVGGGIVTLRWTSLDAVSATVNGDTVALNDSLVVTVPLTATYTLLLTNPQGTTTYKDTVTVALPPKPTGTFTATPNALPVGGGAVTLRWTSQDAVVATLNGVAVALNDSSVVTVPVTTTYTLVLTNPQGTATYANTVTVALPPKPTGTFTATPNALPAGGGAATLRWTSQDAVFATLNGVAVALNDSSVVTVSATATYTLVLTNSQGTATYTNTVTVAPPPPPPVTTEAIYTEAYMNSWNTIRSWSVTLTPTNATPVLNGTKSLKVVHSPWASLQFSKGTWSGFVAENPALYDSLTFWVNGATGFTLGVSCMDASSSTIKTPVNVAVTAGVWKRYSIPMASLSTVSFTSFNFSAAGASVTFYMDDIIIAKK